MHLGVLLLALVFYNGKHKRKHKHVALCPASKQDKYRTLAERRRIRLAQGPVSASPHLMPLSNPPVCV